MFYNFENKNSLDFRYIYKISRGHLLRSKQSRCMIDNLEEYWDEEIDSASPGGFYSLSTEEIKGWGQKKVLDGVL